MRLIPVSVDPVVDMIRNITPSYRQGYSMTSNSNPSHHMKDCIETEIDEVIQVTGSEWIDRSMPSE